MVADRRYRRDLTEVALVEEETSGIGVVKLPTTRRNLANGAIELAEL